MSINSMAGLKRSAASLDAARSWAKRFQSATNPPEEIIVISDEESTPEAPKTSSPLRLLYNGSYNDTCNKDCVELEDLVKSRYLKKTYQFNFAVQLDFFLPHVYPTTEVYFITGHQLDFSPIPSNQYKLRNFVAKLENRYGSHHTKMMINFYTENETETLEIVVLTANLTLLDFNGLTQMVWKSERLSLLAGQKENVKSKGYGFKRDLADYLRKYEIEGINDMIKEMVKYDFSTIEAEFVSSTPGEYSIRNTERNYGYGKLRNVLQENGLYPRKESNTKVLSLVSSIASPFEYDKNTGRVSTLFTHLLCPLMMGHDFPIGGGIASTSNLEKKLNYEPILIFPTVKDVAESTFGYMSGSAVHYRTGPSPGLKKQHEMLKPLFHRWKSVDAKRNDTVAHCKLYTVSQDEWKTVDWVLMTSSNLSKQAWGYPSKKNGDTFKIDSYEAGVLVHSGCFGGKKLVPSFGRDSSDGGDVSIRFPFDLPPERYKGGDQVWNPGFKYSMRDRNGNVYEG